MKVLKEGEIIKYFYTYKNEKMRFGRIMQVGGGYGNHNILIRDTTCGLIWITEKNIRKATKEEKVKLAIDKLFIAARNS